jgi:F-type H+-transporting ATPase subunit b
MSVTNDEHAVETTSVEEHGVVDTHEENLDTHAEVEGGHGSSGDGIAASLGINTQLFTFQLINFAIVGAIVWFLILKPLTQKMEERKKQIDQSIDNAKEIETNLQMSERKYQEKIDEAKVEANKIIQKSSEEGEIVAKRLKEKSQQEIELLVAQAKKNIEIDKQDMKDEIKKETAEMIVLAMEKIFEKKMDEKMDDSFIKKILEDLDKKDN